MPRYRNRNPTYPNFVPYLPYAPYKWIPYYAYKEYSKRYPNRVTKKIDPVIDFGERWLDNTNIAGQYGDNIPSSWLYGPTAEQYNAYLQKKTYAKKKRRTR